jgi:enoyl-[acyl-carrier protein] reductase I
MKLLEGKNALVFGLANKISIAWGIIQAFHHHGARLGVSHAGGVMTKRAVPLAESVGCSFIEACDVLDDEQIERIAEKAREEFGEIDILVHAIAFANREELSGAYYDTSREGFRVAMEVSVYSLVSLARAFRPMMRGGGSILTLSYYGAEKVVSSYNVMGVAKAALESSVRYLARDFGEHGIRVNAISAGPIRTLSSAGVGTFKTLYKRFIQLNPLKEGVSIDDVAGAAVYLSSDLASKVTGEVHHVDSGYNIMGIHEFMD